MEKLTIRMITVVMLFITTNVVAQSANTSPRPIAVQLAKLLANPADYDGKIVKVTGHLQFEKDGSSLFSSSADRDENNLAKAVHTTVRPLYDNEKKQKYVTIIGTFTTKSTEYPTYVGKLVDITRCVETTVDK